MMIINSCGGDGESERSERRIKIIMMNDDE